ncbi:prolyl 3-hydroxylase OGFOD1 isoform X2 [Aethina tumida]|nr:prolyl 3-hydroxylase OGFOD1 isoform X2 [Aethina tumida]
MEFFEESSESEPDLECDIWDDDCKVISKNFIDSHIIGRHLMPTCSRNPEEHLCKKMKPTVEINAHLANAPFIQKFKECFKSNTHFLDEHFELISKPFRVCVFNNFLDNPDILKEVRQEFYELDWNNRNMDLYEFFQSKDLKYLTSDNIKTIHSFLETTVMPWVSELTGFELTHISTTCSLYSNTDYLLVHDDQREDRKVAFVLYLTNDNGWNKSKGGALQLLNKDEAGQPLDVVRDILPANNQLVIFPVANDSYHQVAEVTSLNDCRMSINGWFHTKVPPVFDIPEYKPTDSALYGDHYSKAREVDIDLHSWICDDYLDDQSIKVIQQHIEDNSEISLKNYLKQEPFNEILKTLKSDEVTWKRQGPSNRYNYEVLDLTNLPYILDRCISLFQSTEMFSMLHRYTDLELTSPTAVMKFEFQRWTPGCYSLLTDYNWQKRNELDLIMYFGCKSASSVIGARTQYVTIEDEVQNALITLEPEENNLNIVYRDSARFTKYFSKQSRCQEFYTLICSYCE